MRFELTKSVRDFKNKQCEMNTRRVRSRKNVSKHFLFTYTRISQNDDENKVFFFLFVD